MTRAGWIATAMVVGGVALGSVGGAHATRQQTSFGEFHILSADFHVHAFPGDGTLASWDIAREARRRGLDAVAITNHNQTFASRWMAAASGSSGVLVLGGDEVTMPDVHLAAVGISRPPQWRQSVPATVDAVHAQGGALILAHPVRRLRASFDPVTLSSVDGIEVAHPGMHLNAGVRSDLTEALKRGELIHPGVAPVGSSDFHNVAPIGLCRTLVFARERTVSSVLEALRSGRTVACDQDGAVYGRRPYRTAAEPLCRQAAAERGRESAIERLGKVAAWVGLLGLVCFARGPATRQKA